MLWLPLLLSRQVTPTLLLQNMLKLPRQQANADPSSTPSCWDACRSCWKMITLMRSCSDSCALHRETSSPRWKSLICQPVQPLSRSSWKVRQFRLFSNQCSKQLWWLWWASDQVPQEWVQSKKNRPIASLSKTFWTIRSRIRMVNTLTFYWSAVSHRWCTEHLFNRACKPRFWTKLKISYQPLAKSQLKNSLQPKHMFCQWLRLRFKRLIQRKKLQLSLNQHLRRTKKSTWNK